MLNEAHEVQLFIISLCSRLAVTLHFLLNNFFFSLNSKLGLMNLADVNEAIKKLRIFPRNDFPDFCHFLNKFKFNVSIIEF